MEKYRLLIEIFTALIPISLAIFGSHIASQQYRTNRKKLKIDLFEKRYAVFSAINVFIGAVVKNHTVNQAQRNEYLVGTRGAEFLFDEEIKNYVDQVWEKAVDLGAWAEDKNRPADTTKKIEYVGWYTKQLECINAKFKKYMHVSH